MTQRRITATRSILCVALVAGWVSLAIVEPATAQQPATEGTTATSNVPAPARQLIVAIRSYEPGRSLPQIGAGIVIGLDDDSVYIATALHVVDGADRIWVAFEIAPHDSAGAEIFRQPESGGLDLAVITIPAAAAPAALAASLDRLGEPGRLTSGSEVSPVGCPDEVCWGAPSPPDRILIATPIELWFQSDYVKRGSSGGGLFDRWWEVVGLVTTSDPPRARALPIDYVLAQARTWGAPVSLHRPSIPRAGYRTTVGAAILFPTASPSDRVPSGRLDVTYMVRYPVSLHAGYLRLAPGDLTGCPPDDPNLDPAILIRSPCTLVLNAGVAGLGANLVWRRLTVRALLDLGFGQVQGRYDVGGPSLGTPPVYQPNWVATDAQTTVVAGGALALEYVVMPKVIVQALGGYWFYDDPFDAEGDSFPVEYNVGIPHWFFGAGLKVGL